MARLLGVDIPNRKKSNFRCATSMESVLLEQKLFWILRESIQTEELRIERTGIEFDKQLHY